MYIQFIQHIQHRIHTKSKSQALKQVTRQLQTEKINIKIRLKFT